MNYGIVYTLTVYLILSIFLVADLKNYKTNYKKFYYGLCICFSFEILFFMYFVLWYEYKYFFVFE